MKDSVFTDSEVELLHQHGMQMKAKDLQKHFFPHYSVNQIYAACKRQGIKKQELFDWSIEEIELLKKYYEKLGPTEMARTLLPNRTRDAIWYKASTLGLQVSQETLERNKAILLKKRQENGRPLKGNNPGRPRSKSTFVFQSEIHRKANKVMNAHFEGVKFNKDTEEYRIGKIFGIINY